jgi:glycosyltransferase involved in cell wall biosynthesis
VEQVSIVIPTRDRWAMLGEAVSSVLAQSHPACEIIVVENSTTPASAEHAAALKALHPSVSLLRLPGELGPGGVRNAGLQAVRGEFVLFLDDDDLLHPQMLESNLGCFRADPGLSVVCCHSEASHPPHPNAWPPSTRPRLVDRLDGGRLESEAVLAILRYAPKTCSCLVRRACLGGAPFLERLWAGEDILLWTDLAARGYRFRLNPRVLTHIRFHGGNLHLRHDFTAEVQRYYRLLLAGPALRTQEEKLAARTRFFLHQARRRQPDCVRHLPALLRHPVQLARLLLLLGRDAWETRAAGLETQAS